MKKSLVDFRLITILSFITTLSFYSLAETTDVEDMPSEKMASDFSIQNLDSEKTLPQTGIVVVVQGQPISDSQQIAPSKKTNSFVSNSDVNTELGPATTISQVPTDKASENPFQNNSSQTIGLELMKKMYQATKNLNYELSYVQIRQGKIEPLIYRHALDGDFTIAHSLYLTGPLREVIRLNDVVTYIDPSIEPFSIRSNNMVAPINPLLDTDIEHISNMYDFVMLGRAREAGMACQVVRIVPKDGLRYSYVVWIDERTNLPLRADLVDRNGDVLEQYRTVSFAVDDRILPAMQALRGVKLPEVLNLPVTTEIETDWQVGWVPEGFINHGVNRYRIPMTQTLVENRLYTDGLFEFSVYVSDKNEKNTNAELYRQGRRILHTFIQNKKEISLVGDIPPVAAKRIIESVTFNSDIPTNTN